MTTTAHRNDIVSLVESWLEPERFQDYCPNGLQVEGKEQVRRIITGVTASQALIDAAIEEQADMILVHHGYFWKGEDQRIQGMKKRRLQALLGYDISLLAYHLPLDAHPELGNNRQLADVLGITSPAAVSSDRGLLWLGDLPSPMSPDAFSEHLSHRLERQSLRVGKGKSEIRRVAWCTGAAQGFLGDAIASGADAFISGEISEPTFHTAQECGVHYYAAGHHATERYGVQALGQKIADVTGIEHRFIDIDNPV